MRPLIQPEWDYESVGPWIVTLEWRTGKIVSNQIKDLPHAIFKFWDSLECYGRFGTPDAPNRRVLIDARGVTILGALDGELSEHPVVATKEVMDLQEQLGAEPVNLLSLEMEIRWNIESNR